MKLYADLKNIEAMVHNGKVNRDAFIEVTRMIRRGLDVQYNFANSDEIKKNPLLVIWMNSVSGQGVHSSPSFCPPESIVPADRPVKSNFYINFDKSGLCSMYFLDMNENTEATIRDKGSVIACKPGSELDLIEYYSQLDDKNLPSLKLSNWESYCPNLPLTDIVICDDYYFKHRNVYTEDNNEFLIALAKRAKNQLNVVLIVKEKEQDESIDLDEECRNIRAQLCKNSSVPLKKCNVTILTSYRDHNRHAITNYYRIESSHGFFIHGDTKPNDNTDIKPHILRSAFNTSLSFLNEYQIIAKEPVQRFSSCGNGKISNFLEFPEITK